LRGRSDRAATAERTDIPVLVIAASSSELDPMLAERAGADQLVLAPIELEQLAADLERVVTAWRASHPGRKWADEAVLGPA
jgi:CheY-like chemotaxis protein